MSTCKNVGTIWGSVRGEYRLSTDFGARRRSVALLVDEELSLRLGCGRATDSPPSTGDARALYSQCTHNALTPRVFSFFSLGHLLCGRRTQHVRTEHVISAWSLLTLHFPSSIVQ